MDVHMDVHKDVHVDVHMDVHMSVQMGAYGATLSENQPVEPVDFAPGAKNQPVPNTSRLVNELGCWAFF